MREELTLHRDLLHLHARSGTPVCFCSCHGINDWCLKLPIDVDDYYVLLRDITFIEAITIRSSVMVKLLCYITILAVTVSVITVGMLAGSCFEDTDKSASADGNSVDKEDECKVSGQAGPAAVAVASVLWLLGWMTRRPHPIGVLPGGGRRGKPTLLVAIRRFIWGCRRKCARVRR